MAAAAQNMLEIGSLSVHYGPVQALNSVNLKIAQGEIVALLGSNGAGKSTLMRGINGLSPASAGDIVFEGKRINDIPTEVRPKLGLASILEGRGMLPRMSVLENLQMGAYLRRGDGIDQDLEAIFKMFPVLRERAAQSAGTLSGGEQQMLAFGRAIMLKPKLILMDEPSMGLAPVIVERVFDAIKEINKSGVTILLVEQNARMALSVADKFYVLSTGAIVLEGIVKNGELIVDKGNGKLVSVTEENLEEAYLEGKETPKDREGIMKITTKKPSWIKTAITSAAVIAGIVAVNAVAQEKPTYKIAYIGPITGPNTSVGVGTMNSMDLAIRQANASGKLPFKLEFVPETDDSKPAAGVAAVQKTCGDKSVLAASAHWNSPVAMATGSYFNDCNLLNLVAGAAANGITKQGWKAVGRVNTPFRYALPELARAAYEDLGLRKIAIVHSLDDFGNDAANEFGAEFTKLGGQIVFRDGYNVGDRDFTSLLTKVRSSRPEAVMHGGVSTEAALIARQMRQLGMKQPYLGHSGFQTVAYVEAAGKDGNGTLVASLAPFPEDLPGGKQFLADYAAAGFKDPPDVYGVFGYAAGQTLIELIKRYGTDRKAIVDNFRSAKDIETIFGKQSFDADGELQPKKIGLSVLQDGKWSKFEKDDYKKKYMK